MKVSNLIRSVGTMMIVAAVAFAVAACSNGNADKNAGSKTEPRTEVASQQPEALSQQADADADVARMPTVLDFYATWCGPCKQIAPLFHTLQETYAGKIRFVSIDVDAEPDVAAKYDVQAMPTFVFLDAEGNEVDRLVGADPNQLQEKVKVLSALNS